MSLVSTQRVHFILVVLIIERKDPPSSIVPDILFTNISRLESAQQLVSTKLESATIALVLELFWLHSSIDNVARF